MRNQNGHNRPARQSAASRSAEQAGDLQLAPEGGGPLVQRDFVVVLEGSSCTPAQVVERIRTDFPRFSPAELARFDRPPGAEPLAVGDGMPVRIRGFGDTGVCVTHLEPHSLTLTTLEGHAEAGRITFGAFHDEAGRLVCRIRSRARLRDRAILGGYRLAGRHAQSRVWTTFLQRLAAECGGQILGGVLASSDVVEELPEDRAAGAAPTLSLRRP